MRLERIASATILATAALMLAACSVSVNPDAARVDCGTPGPHGVDCTLTRTGGDGTIQACWDLVITCRNEGVMSASACHRMAGDQGLATQNMPVADFSGQQTCDAPASGQVERLQIIAK